MLTYIYMHHSIALRHVLILNEFYICIISIHRLFCFDFNNICVNCIHLMCTDPYAAFQYFLRAAELGNPDAATASAVINNTHL